MCADRDSSSSPGIRALIGRFLHGLWQSRVFQLLAAAWSYLVGLSGASLFSFLPSAWVVHRSVGPDELPEMLEALGLRSGPWEELGECLEELGPWKELLSPAMKADLGIPSHWAGYVPSSKEQESWDSDLEELGTWHSTMWKPGLGTWKEMGDSDQEEEDQCHSKSSVNSFIHHKVMSENGDDEKNGALLHPSPLSMVSCIFNPGSSGVFTWLELGNEHNLQNKDLLDETCGPDESKVEIEHIRNKRLWFLQQNQDVPTTDPKEEENVKNQGHVHHVSVLSDPAPFIKLDVPVSGWHDGHNKVVSPDNQLLSTYDLNQCNIPESPSTDPDSKPCHPLSLLVPKPFILDNTQTKYPPSPDQDQGYHSLEDWQCLNIKQNLQSGGIFPPNVCESAWDSDGALVPMELSCTAVRDVEVDQHSDDDLASDLEDEIHAPAPPVCTNKLIGYILGTVESEDEEENPSSSCEDDWDDDDGFDSEGSVSAVESDPPVPEEVVLWNSFCNTDPYNPQNFTASLQTGPVAEVTDHLEDREAVISDGEESWCDSDAVSDSEDEFSADEQENLKLWNGFLRSEDPYNPLYFKASVQTSQRNKQTTDSVTKPLELVCTSVSSCELTVPTPPSDSRLLRLRKKHSVSLEESANVGRKKVTFCNKVTIHYVCNEEERKGHWEEFARDRCRFQKRIQETQCVIGHCFTPDHRQRVWNRMHEIWGS